LNFQQALFVKHRKLYTTMEYKAFFSHRKNAFLQKSFALLYCRQTSAFSGAYKIPICTGSSKKISAQKPYRHIHFQNTAQQETVFDRG